MLNNEDKKYLKDTVEKKLDNLDKKIDKGVNGAKSASNPNSEIGKKLNDLYKQNQDREDREKLIEELQKKVNSGDATLAQKIELINQNLQKKIPDDVRDAWKMTAAEMKTGGKQAAKGIDSLITKIARVNPMLAMLYASSKDITKAAWDITAGTAKFGVGLAKGAAGILNSAVNMFKKKEEKEETPEEETPKQEEQGRISIEGKTVEEYEDEEKSTAEKINEMHEWIFNKFPKMKDAEAGEEKKKQSILAKGLGGLGKSMQAVNKVIEVIAAKQKLILGGLVIGALGILALVGWFKGGGFSDLLNKAIHKKLVNEPDYDKSKNIGLDVLKTEDSANFSNEDTIKKFIQPNNNVDKSYLADNVHKFGKFHGDDFRKYAKSLGVSHNVLNKSDASSHIITQSENKETTVLVFPFPTMIIEVIPDPTQPKYVALRIAKMAAVDNPFYTTELRNSQTLNGVTYGLVNNENGGNLTTVTYTKVLDKLQPEFQVILPYTPIAVLDAGYQIIGDIEKFLKDSVSKTTLTNYSEKRNEMMKKFDDKYRKTPENYKKLQKERAVERANKIAKDTYENNKGLLDKASYNIDTWLNGKPISDNDYPIGMDSTSQSYTKDVIEEGNVSQQSDDLSGELKTSVHSVPSTDTNQGNTTDNKVNTQQTQLRNLQLKELNLSDAEKSTLYNDDKKGNNIIALNNEQSTPSQPSELFNAAQWNAATEA